MYCKINETKSKLLLYEMRRRILMFYNMFLFTF